jgi:hypothetical protein
MVLVERRQACDANVDHQFTARSRNVDASLTVKMPWNREPGLIIYSLP